jgi:hypothetical protein
MTDILETYNNYNPVSRYAIRPALQFVDAHNHPIRGGIAAAVASGLAHYALLEGIGQASDYFFGTNFRDPQTKMVLTSIPAQVHFFVGVNILSNLGLGMVKHLEKKAEKDAKPTLESRL